MPSSRLTLPAWAALAATAALLAPASPVAASHSKFSLHVRAESGGGDHSVDIELPWSRGKGGSPFDFTADTNDDISVPKLRWAWTALKKLPEGQPVVIKTKEETIRATRRAGYLVLEPQPAAENDRTRIKIPDYIIETILAHDGRLTDEDVDDLVQARGKVTLVKVSSTNGGVNVWIDREGAEDDLD